MCQPVEMRQVVEVRDDAVLPENGQILLLRVFQLRAVLLHHVLVQSIAYRLRRERHVQVRHAGIVTTVHFETLQMRNKYQLING